MVHDDLEAEQVGIETARIFRIGHLKIRHDASDCHLILLI
ncbi:hypothetical protein ABIA27_004310 [Sinorhizobium fredii]